MLPCKAAVPISKEGAAVQILLRMVGKNQNVVPNAELLTSTFSRVRKFPGASMDERKRLIDKIVDWWLLSTDSWNYAKPFDLFHLRRPDAARIQSITATTFQIRYKQRKFLRLAKQLSQMGTGGFRPTTQQSLEKVPLQNQKNVSGMIFCHLSHLTLMRMCRNALLLELGVMPAKI